MINIIAIILMALSFGCARNIRPDEIPEFTKLGIMVKTNGQKVDLDRIDAKYVTVAQCVNLPEAKYKKWAKKVQVRVIANYKVDGTIEYWECPQHPIGCTGRFRYIKEPPMVESPPSFQALAHEFGHYFAYMIRGYWGQYDEGGCAISHNCGDPIDSYFRRGEIDPNWQPQPKVFPCFPYFE